MSKSLICEGPCNPILNQVDEAITLVRSDEVDNDPESRVSTLDESSLEILHSLVHTPHTSTGDDLYTCSTCGTARQY